MSKSCVRCLAPWGGGAGPIKLLNVFVLVWQNEGSNIGLDGNVGKYTVNYFFKLDKKKLQPNIPSASGSQAIIPKGSPEDLD